MTNRKLTLCPYCGESFAKTAISIDHIIPKQIGGCDKFSIFSCKSCNSNLSKIEQRAIQTVEISYLLMDMSESGFNIKSRRKKEVIPLQKSVGLSCGSPAKMYYNTKNHERRLVFLLPPKVDPLDGQSHTFITPLPENDESPEDVNSLLCLTNKIILGTCAWLWGDRFLKSKQATFLRNGLEKVSIDKVIEMNSNEKHLTLPDMPEEDALNNQPHHSVLISKLGNKVRWFVKPLWKLRVFNSCGRL